MHIAYYNARGTVQQRAIGDVRVARDPANVGRAKVHVVVVVVEHVPKGCIRVQHVTSLAMHHSFGFPGRSAAP